MDARRSSIFSSERRVPATNWERESSVINLENLSSTVSSIPLTEFSAEETPQISLLDLPQRTVLDLSLEEALSLHTRQEPFVLLFINLPRKEISRVRSTFKLHSAIENECSSSDFNIEDQIMNFQDHFLVNISDVQYKDKIERRESIKIVYFAFFMLIFSRAPIRCVRKVCKGLNFVSLQEDLEPETPVLMKRETDFVPVDIGSEFGCTEIESFFHKILERVLSGIEWLIHKFEKKAQICLKTAASTSPDERIDFIFKLSHAQKEIVYLKSILRNKPKLMSKLSKCNAIGKQMQKYLESMNSRAQAMKQRLLTSRFLLKKAENIYDASNEKSVTDYSQRLNNNMKKFASIGIIFMPLTFIAQIAGIHVKMPMDEVDSLWPFSALCGFCIFVFMAIIFYFKQNNWV